MNMIEQITKWQQAHKAYECYTDLERTEADDNLELVLFAIEHLKGIAMTNRTPNNELLTRLRRSIDGAFAIKNEDGSTKVVGYGLFDMIGSMQQPTNRETSK